MTNHSPSCISDDEDFLAPPTPQLLAAQAAYVKAIACGTLILRDPLNDALRDLAQAKSQRDAMAQALFILDPENPALAPSASTPDATVVGYQVMEVTTGKVTRGDTDLLTHAAAIRELIALRPLHGPDLYAISTILSGDLDGLVDEHGPIRTVE